MKNQENLAELTYALEQVKRNIRQVTKVMWNKDYSIN